VYSCLAGLTVSDQCRSSAAESEDRSEYLLAYCRTRIRGGAHSGSKVSHGWVTCLVRRGVLLAVVSVSWLVPVRSWASSSR
jgi:hypothetical protein